MKRILLAAAAVALLIPSFGCISVREDEEPDTVSTTTTSTGIGTAPVTSTVERTTVY